MEPKAAGPSHDIVAEQRPHDIPRAPQQQHVVMEPSPPTVQAATLVNGQIEQPAVMSIEANGNAAKSSSADIFEEAKRKMLLREQEEKIPVFPTEPDMEAATAAAAKKKDEEELPHMSATSYPGQEWNPYGEGFDSWDD